MPVGRVHLKIWKSKAVFAILFAAVIQVITFKRALLGDWAAMLSGTLTYGGYLLGYYVDPDYDQANTTSGEWRLMNDFGILGALIVGWFTPYGLVLRHRSTITHFPFLSTFIRLGWLLLFPPFAYALYLGHKYLYDRIPALLFFVWLGLSISDMVHALADFGFLNYRRFE